jgi:hypothetical protein
MPFGGRDRRIKSSVEESLQNERRCYSTALRPSHSFICHVASTNECILRRRVQWMYTGTLTGVDASHDCKRNHR